jgi:hypothetical protein
MDEIKADTALILGQYWDPPSYKREVTCSSMPLDQFSVFMDNLATNYPFLRDIFNVHPQTKDPRELINRHWTDMYWQSGGVFQEACHTAENVRFVGPGWDYILAYYLSVYHGILPGSGPYDDGELTDDLDDDDDIGNDDDASDDDDTVDDDDSNDDDDDDDEADNGNAPSSDSSDDDDTGCCG